MAKKTKVAAKRTRARPASRAKSTGGAASSSPASPGLSTRAQAVTELGLSSPRNLDKLIERGAPGPVPGKRGTARYNVPAIRQWREERAARIRPDVELMLERAKEARVRRRMGELKLRQARGELVRVADAVEAQREIAAAVKASLLAVPRRAVLEGLPREHEALVKGLIVQALRELAELTTVAQLRVKSSTTEAA